MRKLSQTEIRREFVRQRGRLLFLLERLDEKDLKRQAYNTQLAKRRRYYAPKANGRGRPVKLFKLPSREDEARRAQYVTEIRLLAEALAFDAVSVDKLLDWLAILKTEKTQDENWPLREHKIDRLIVQFSDKPAKSAPPKRRWRVAGIYEYLNILRERQRARVAALGRLPVRTLAEQDEEDEERAYLAVLDRFCTSAHFATPKRFTWVARTVIRASPVSRPEPHNRDFYRVAWVKAVDRIADDVIGRFGAS